MNFPVLNHINDLLPFIANNQQFRVQEQPNGTTIVCYMLQDEDTFRGEHEEFYKECRGITFDTASGKVVSRTLHKFQNVGENDATQPHLIPWDKITRVMDKRDGSMITPVLVDNGTDHAHIACKTKKTFDSAEAKEATLFLHKDMALWQWSYNCLKAGLTPTFEWTSPRFPIVLLYEKDELTLLQVRENITGRYLTEDEIAALNCPAPIVPNIIEKFITDGKVDYEKFRYAQLTAEGVEGWIVQAGGEMWKVKTKWYCDLHHSVTFTRWRDVARSVLDEQSDDLKAAFAMTGRDIQPIIDVEKVIFGEIERVRLLCEELAGLGKGFERTAKDMAMMYRDHENFKEIMRMFRGQDVNWNEWYLNKYIRNWSLQVIAPGNVQMMTEVAEDDNGTYGE